LSVESWATSVTSSSVTSPAAARRRYDDDADNNKHLTHHVTAGAYAPYELLADSQPASAGRHVPGAVDSLHCRARHGLDLAVAAAAAAAAADDDDDDGRRNELTRTVAVRPWLSHSCDR